MSFLSLLGMCEGNAKKIRKLQIYLGHRPIFPKRYIHQRLLGTSRHFVFIKMTVCRQHGLGEMGIFEENVKLTAQCPD
jgi:hypothetical protein